MVNNHQLGSLSNVKEDQSSQRKDEGGGDPNERGIPMMLVRRVVNGTLVTNSNHIEVDVAIIEGLQV
ncbi:hypothetical protein KUTeg_006077 [Tegillarca granosa]|uniref:Uncharacterized protein n=1 Tax=Tegillarca granosa TaxID=220873 RepID=A0ABQ9FK28_TEGGR|nr:hypothetical protein KUTeg_006077 [Tegillarca granosa]